MSECVIVAIPRQDDYVHKISSEKIAHMTLLYLGELSSEDHKQKILDFVEHASSTLKPFGMEVSRRGLLGDSKADVLYFTRVLENPIYRYRSSLLSNDVVRSEYNTAYQYPQWTPHLTLGYPETPANKDDRGYGIDWVGFDRIAVWFGEFEGSEFVLNEESVEHMGPISRQQTPEDYQLFHYGVKGMKWGVQRDEMLLNRIAGRPIRSQASTKEARKAENQQTKTAYKEYKKNTTRQERRADRNQALEEKGRYIVETAAKNPRNMFTAQVQPGQMPYMVTGKQLIEHLGAGGMFNAKYSDVLAVQLGPEKKGK